MEKELIELLTDLVKVFMNSYNTNSRIYMDLELILWSLQDLQNKLAVSKNE